LIVVTNLSEEIGLDALHERATLNGLKLARLSGAELH